jgi:hypothetical protein
VVLGSFLGLGSPGDWDWTAIGTILLALATFALAWQNRTLVRSSRAELVETRQDVAIGREQAETAREALAAQTQPLLSSVPRGIISPTGYTADIEATFDPQNGGFIKVPFRNIGNGVALIKAVMFWAVDGGSGGVSEDAAVPEDEISYARIELAANNRLGSDVVVAQTNFSVVMTYADAADRPRGATRLDVYYSDSRGRWYVRQVHFGDDAESVRTNPRASSGPTT